MELIILMILGIIGGTLLLLFMGAMFCILRAADWDLE